MSLVTTLWKNVSLFQKGLKLQRFCFSQLCPTIWQLWPRQALSLHMMPEVFQVRRRNSGLEDRKYNSKREMKSDQVLTSAESDGWTWWRTGV